MSGIIISPGRRLEKVFVFILRQTHVIRQTLGRLTAKVSKSDNPSRSQEITMFETSVQHKNISKVLERSLSNAAA